MAREKMFHKKEFTKAVDAHEQWKTRLRSAIDTGQSNIRIADAYKDNVCDFGRWLYGNPDLRTSSPEYYDEVRRLHADFHREVGSILSSALGGRKQQATKAILAGSAFSRISATLSKALAEWQASL